MEKSFNNLELKKSRAEAARTSDGVRCLPHRMGSIMPGYTDGRPMVPAREDTPHKRPGAACGYTSGEDIPERLGNQESTAAAGQSDSSCLYEQPGRDSSANTIKLARDLWMWCLWRDILLTAQYLPEKENVKADTESRVMRDSSDWMLNPLIFQRILSIGGRPVRDATDLPATSLLQLETRPIGRSDGRLSPGLERLRQPSLEPYRESIDEGGILGGRANTVSPNLALSAMVSQVVELAGVSSSENRTRPTDSESVRRTSQN